MSKTTLISMIGLMSFMLFACVSKNQHVELQDELNSTETQLAGERQQLADLQAKYRKMQNTNMSLKNTIEDLKFELRQEKTAVIEKEKDISELDLHKKKIEADLEQQLAKKEQEVERLTKTRREIEDNLKEQIEKGDIKIKQIESKLEVTFANKILFSSGSVKIKAKGKELLSTLADTLRDEKGKNIVVEGHTDDVQIGKSLQSKFPTNWELSAARAAAVVRYLQDNAGIEPQRLTASGFSHFQPVASNKTAEGRSRNRRIDIVLLPQKDKFSQTDIVEGDDR
jgi:chemotaxis protein MotB